jgi:hypothetical protein
LSHTWRACLTGMPASLQSLFTFRNSPLDYVPDDGETAMASASLHIFHLYRRKPRLGTKQ